MNGEIGTGEERPAADVVELLAALERAGIALPSEWLDDAAAEYRDLRTRIRCLRE
jgi:hypothetical protein